MIKDIRIFPRSEIENLINTGAVWNIEYPWALISIWGSTSPLIPEESKTEFEILASKGCADYKTIQFHDITKKQYDHFKSLYKGAEKRFILFSKSKARNIIDYINFLRDDEREITLVIHCEQGVSRSGAIGLFACRYLGLNERRFKLLHPKIRPNAFVYDTLCKIAKL